MLGAVECSERLREQGVVAELRVRVEGEVVGGERDVVVEQELQAALELRVDGGDAGAPEQPVVDKQQVGPLSGGQLEQLGVCGDAGGDRVDRVRTGDLQAVDAVVLEAGRLEQTVDLGEDLGGGGGHRATIAACGCGWRARGCGMATVWDTSGASGRGAAW